MLESMVDRDRENPEVWIDRANALIDGKNRALLPDAVTSATQAIDLMNKRAEPDKNRLRTFYERRGVALRRLGRLSEAMSDFNAILDLRPTDAFAIAETGAIHVSMGNVDEGIRRLRQSLEMYDRDSWALDQLARAYLRKVPSDITQAYNAANRAVGISAGWLPRRAEIFRRDGGNSLESAETDFRQAVQRQVDPLQSRVGLGIVLLMRNRAAEARDVFEQTIAYQPAVGDDDTRSRAQALALLDRYDEAEQALGLTPGQQHVDADRYKVMAEIRVLRAAGGAGRELAADHPQLLVAMHDLIQHVRWSDVDYGDLQTDLLLRGIADHPMFQELIAAIQKPLSDPSRDLALARIALTLAARLRELESLPAQFRVDCLQAAEQFQQQARRNGATDAQILNITREATTRPR
jgi:tetratricopeptide (TPR) repeat protein